MRFAPRLAVPVTLLVFALAGCGGATVAVQEVPGDPAPLSVPGTAEGLAPATTADADPDAHRDPGRRRRGRHRDARRVRRDR